MELMNRTIKFEWEGATFEFKSLGRQDALIIEEVKKSENMDAATDLLLERIVNIDGGEVNGEPCTVEMFKEYMPQFPVEIRFGLLGKFYAAAAAVITDSVGGSKEGAGKNGSSPTG